MTQAQKTQFEKALAKATIEDLHIIGKGTVKATGQKFYAVSSSDGSSCYSVIVAGYALICSCQAGRKGQYCKHRALVRQELMQRQAEVEAAYVRQGAAIMVAALDAADAERAAALPLRRDGGPRWYRNDARPVAPVAVLEERATEW